MAHSNDAEIVTSPDSLPSFDANHTSWFALAIEQSFTNDQNNH